MSSLIPFSFESFPVRVVEIEGRPLFVAKDVATLLGYADTDQSVRSHCKHAKSLKDMIPLNQRDQENQELELEPRTKLIPESDVYRLVMRSKLESAERFQDWVVEEVLPQIRKTGSYKIDPPKPKRKRASSQLSGKLFIARQIRSVLRVSDTSYIGMVAKIAESEGIEPTFLPAYVDETLTKAMTGMLKDLDHRLATKVRSVVHPALEEMGILERLSRPSTTKPGQVSRFLSLTTEGLKYGRNETSPNNPRETQPLYYVDRFGDLLKRLEAHLQRRPANLTLTQDAGHQDGDAA